jgi:hypothetical protein
MSAPAALDLLRANAYGRGLTVDDVAEEFLSGLLRAREIADSADAPG